jgi:uncharacterized RDD family membrane protein YckC
MESTGSPGIPTPDEGPASLEAAAAAPPPPAAPPPAASAAAAAPASTSPAWLNQITSTQTMTGAAGLVYADIPSRIFAYIIDAIILSVGFFILFSIFGALFFATIVWGGFDILAFIWLVVLLLIYAAGSAIYFIYTWTRMRGSPGQRILGLETLNAADGAVLTQPQAIRRWLFLFGPSVIATVLSLTPILGGLGTLIGLLIWAYSLYLLYTAASSPTRQGFHDTQASTVVVKIKR